MRTKFFQTLGTSFIVLMLCFSGMGRSMSLWSSGVRGGGQIAFRSSLEVIVVDATVTTFEPANPASPEEDEQPSDPPEGGEEEQPNPDSDGGDQEEQPGQPENGETEQPNSSESDKTDQSGSAESKGPDQPESSDEAAPESPEEVEGTALKAVKTVVVLNKGIAMAGPNRELHAAKAASDEDSSVDPEAMEVSAVVTGTVSEDEKKVSFPAVSISGDGTKAVYSITLQNSGTARACLSGYQFIPEGADSVYVEENVKKNVSLEPGEEQTITFTVTLTGHSTEKISAGVTLEYAAPDVEKAPTAGYRKQKGKS